MASIFQTKNWLYNNNKDFQALKDVILEAANVWVQSQCIPLVESVPRDLSICPLVVNGKIPQLPLELWWQLLIYTETCNRPKRIVVSVGILHKIAGVIFFNFFIIFL